MNARPSRRGDRCVRLAVALAFLACAGCSHLPFVKKRQGPVNIAAEGKAPLTVSELQFENLRFADNYTESVAHASDRVAKALGSREAQVETLKWKLEQGTAAYVDATGPNPLWNALDLVGLATVALWVAEDRQSHDLFGGNLDALVETHRSLQASAWSLADQFLEPSEHKELADLFAEWRKQNPNERSVSGVHFREFAVTLGKASSPSNVKATSIFSLLYLDPFAGLDPTTVAIEQSRELAARTVAYAERMPTLLRWQAELLAIQIAHQPDPQELMADIDRVSHSLESVSKTAEGLPALVDTQRREAIDQIFAGVTDQRQALLADLDAREGRLRSLMGETRQTLDAGAKMSDSLKGTIGALDAFVHYVSPPTDPNAPPKPAGKPFDPLDYGKAANDLGGMARDLTALLVTVDKTAPQLGALGGKTAEEMKGVVDRAFWRGIVLVLLLLVGSPFAALAYRALARRLFTKPAV
jgi:hypothetical protein